MKRFIALLLTLMMVLPMSLSTAAAEQEVLVLDVYDDAANYHGMQTGWFGQVVKERFNIELNIIAPQVAGDAVYQTRAADGNLGDIIILDKTRFQDCLKAGLIREISDKIPACDHLTQYKVQIDSLNQGLGYAEGVYYGIPSEMTDTSPVSLTDDVIYSSPMLRWDQYTGVGRPEMADLQGLLDTLKLIHEKYPANEAGDPAYPLSLWADWDGNDNMIGIANVVQLTTWYGEKVKGSAILRPDNTFVEIYDKGASYYKLARFLNKANRMGLVDPDSGEQDWNAVCAKMSNGQVNLMWYSWSTGFWNSQERMDNGTAFIFVPVKDQRYYADADAFFGTTRVFGVGSKVEGEKYDRIMEFLNWYASPEAMVFQHAGIEGLNYTLGEDGKFIPYMDNALMDNLPVPEYYGGGGYQDGFNAINQWIGNALNTNPATGEGYAMKHWAAYKEKNMTQMKKEWMEHFDAADSVDYMKKNGVLLASPNVSVALQTDTNDIGLIRVDVNKALCEYTWQLIFCDEADFDTLWDEMVEQMDGFGYKDLYAFDCANYQTEVDAKVYAASAVAE